MSTSLAERWVRFVALGVGMIFVAFPFYWMILTAFTPRDALFRPPFALIRFDFSLGNFAELLFATEFLVYLKNSLIAAAFAFALSWNDFAFAFILQTDTTMFTLPVGLATFVERTAIHWGMIMSSSALISIPTFALVFFLQRYLMSGLGLGGH